MTDTEFFEIVGYLTSQIRGTKLDIETHPSRRESLEEQYNAITGEILQEDNINYYVWDEETNKWGAELRIYFNGNLETMPVQLAEIRVSYRPGSGYNNRVNNNDFVWRLIEYGFRARNEQDHIQIREYVPNQFMADFEDGLGII